MDEQRRLVSELQTKLAELDQRVGNYRRDMVAEFEKYAEDLLQDVPKALSEDVSQSIAMSLKDYKALYPGTAACESGSSPGTSKEPAAPDHLEISQPQYSFPQPITYRRSAQLTDDYEAPRSPHEREREFQGLFTPSYLPLLGDNRHERRTSFETPTSPRATSDPLKVDASTDPRSLTTTPDLPKPLPKRRDTEDSFVSDTSEGTIRRSALRRSSSSLMKQSPRRVRFEVEGVEVLPTSSPLPPSALSAGGISSADVTGEEPELEQVEDVAYFAEEESPPRPKRISSSQRLLLLSRTASQQDDGTTWTTVTAPPDGSPSVEKVSRSNESSSELSDTAGVPRALNSIGNPAVDAQPLGKPNSTRTSADDHEVDTESDDDTLDMPSLSSMKGKRALPPATILSPAAPILHRTSQSPGGSTQISDRRWKDFASLGGDGQTDLDQELKFNEGDLDDGVFSFEEKTYHGSPPEEPEADDEDDSEITQSPSPPTEIDAANLSQYSRSPARPITRPIEHNPSQPAGSLGAVGSFRGHPFSMPVVNEDLHARAAAMGNVNSFVGSVDGRSGFDDGDMASYRASGKGASFTGVPRSLTQRMMLEDYIEAEKTERNKS